MKRRHVLGTVAAGGVGLGGFELLRSSGPVVDRSFRAERVTRSTPLRPVALLAGLLGSTLTTLAGAAVVERTPLD